MAKSATKKSRKNESPLTEEHEHDQDKEDTSDAISSTSNINKKKKSDSNRSVSKKSQKRARKEALENLEEERLTALLFGGGDVNDDELYDENDKSENEEVQQQQYEVEEEEGEEGDLKFEIDRDGDDDDDDDDDGEPKNEEVDHAWNDEDDDDDGEHSITMEGDDSDDEDEDGGKVVHSAPAWEDPDDATIKLVDGSSRLKKLRNSRQETQALSSNELEQRLRQRYESSSHATARTDWAAEPKEQQKIVTDDNDEENYDTALEIFSTSKSLLASSRNQLPPNILDIVRCPDANLTDPNKAVVRCIDFHPGSDPEQPLMLTAGLDKTLRFFQIGEEKSEKIHGIHFPQMPIYNASFLGDTGKVVLSGRRNFFYMYDLVAGKVDLIPKIHGRDERSWERHTVSPDGSLIAFVGNDGYVVLVDSHSKQCIGTLKLNGSVRAITFTPDGSCIVASGSDGDIYRWDVKSRQCIERFANGDGTITSSLSASSTNLAVGAESGVVNLYSEYNYRSQQRSRSSLLNGIQTKTPLKSIMNLHTSADKVQFNSDGQILAMSSQREQHGLKLLHVPTRTVFSNWPTGQTPLGYVWDMKFSPRSKFLAIGNDKGKCLLYKINHYHN